MPKTEDDKGSKVKWDFANPPVAPKPSVGVPPFPIKQENVTSDPRTHVESVISQTSTQTRSSNPSEPEANTESESASAETHAEVQPPVSSSAKIADFLATGGTGVALLLCIALIGAMGFILWTSIQKQSRIENEIIASERRQANSMMQMKNDLVKEVQDTRAIVQDRIHSIDSTQAILQKKIIDSERLAADMQQRFDALSQEFAQEKLARQNEINLLLNLTRVRINNIEKRQQELEKSGENKNGR